jgi:hypothetical protein
LRSAFAKEDVYHRGHREMRYILQKHEKVHRSFACSATASLPPRMTSYFSAPRDHGTELCRPMASKM